MYEEGTIAASWAHEFCLKSRIGWKIICQLFAEISCLSERAAFLCSFE